MKDFNRLWIPAFAGMTMVLWAGFSHAACTNGEKRMNASGLASCVNGAWVDVVQMGNDVNARLKVTNDIQWQTPWNGQATLKGALDSLKASIDAAAILPSGMMCGSYDSVNGDPNVSCLGHSPRTSCPGGYTRAYYADADGHYFYTCFKN